MIQCNIVSLPLCFSEAETVTETEEEVQCNGHVVSPASADGVKTSLALGIKNTSDEIAEQPCKSKAERAVGNCWPSVSQWFAVLWLDFRDAAKKVKSHRNLYGNLITQ